MPVVSNTIVRAVALVGLLTALYSLGRLGGLASEFNPDQIRGVVEEAGALGFLLFLLIFAGGELIHIPGLVFVAAGILAYGRLWGALAGFVGAEFSLSVSFCVVRAVGGQPLRQLRWRWARALLDRLETQPLRTVAILRLMFWMAPLLNYTLAMSRVRFRHYAIGSAIGLVLPIAAAAVLFDWVLSTM